MAPVLKLQTTKSQLMLNMPALRKKTLSKLFECIRNELFENKSIDELSKLSEMLNGLIKDTGIR